MTLAASDPHAGVQPYPDHPRDEHDEPIYDPGCWMCRNVTAQPPPGTAEAQRAGKVAGT